MKKLFLLIFLSFFSLSIFAQSSNAVLFTEKGEKFIVILNGIRQNDRPETNIKITGLNAEYYKLKIIFDNLSLGEKNFNLSVEPGSETSYSIKKNSKGEYVLRFENTTPLSQANSIKPTQVIIAYRSNPASNASPVAQSKNRQTQSVSIQNQWDKSSGNKETANNSFAIDSTGNDKVQMTEQVIDEGKKNSVIPLPSTGKEINSAASSPVVPEDNKIPLPIYNGKIGCSSPMNPADFSTFQESVNANSYDDNKMTIAKQVTGIQCLVVDQVKEIIQLFSFEESKLEFAKFAYNHTYDLENYTKLNELFTFETSIEELNEYIKSK